MELHGLHRVLLLPTHCVDKYKAYPPTACTSSRPHPRVSTYPTEHPATSEKIRHLVFLLGFRPKISDLHAGGRKHTFVLLRSATDSFFSFEVVVGLRRKPVRLIISLTKLLN